MPEVLLGRSNQQQHVCVKFSRNFPGDELKIILTLKVVNKYPRWFLLPHMTSKHSFKGMMLTKSSLETILDYHYSQAWGRESCSRLEGQVFDFLHVYV